MHEKVREILQKAYGPEYGSGRAVKVSSDSVGKLRKIAASMGPEYADVLERAIDEKSVQVNFSETWIKDQAGKLTNGMVYISEEHDFGIDWLSEEIASDDSGVASSPIVAPRSDEGDWLP